MRKTRLAALVPSSLVIVALVGVSIPACRAAWAQQVVTQFSIGAGSSTDARGLRSTTVSAAPGVVFFPLAPVNVSLSASGSRLQDDEWQAGADAGLSARTRERMRSSLTLNAAGSYVRTSYGATFSVGDVTPALEMHFGPITAFAGARLASGRTIMRGARTAAAPVPVTLTSITRTARGPVYGAQWQAMAGDTPLLLSYREERSRVAGTLVLDRAASASIAVGRMLLGGSAGRRTSPVERMNVSSGSASLSLTSSLLLQASAGRYPSSWLTGASSGRFVSVGLVLRNGGPRPLRLPRPEGAPRVPRDATRLSIRAPEASRVELAGDWNNWTPVPARRAANGVWYADVTLAPGEYRYAFRVDGNAWRVPEGAVASDDGFGGKSAFVTVASGAARVSTHNQEDR